MHTHTLKHTYIHTHTQGKNGQQELLLGMHLVYNRLSFLSSVLFSCLTFYSSIKRNFFIKQKTVFQMSCHQCCKTLYSSQKHLHLFPHILFSPGIRQDSRNESVHGFLQLQDDLLKWRTLQHLAEGPYALLNGSPGGGLAHL
jgi:hypothetical protein